MTAYIWRASEKYQEYDGSNLPSPPWQLDRWDAPTLPPFFPDHDKKRKVKPTADFVASRYPYIVSQKAVDALRSIFDSAGLLYPIALAGQASPYYCFSCTRIVDCLDVDRSKIKRSVVDGSIAVILEPTFRTEVLADETIFAIPQVPHRLYMTERAKAVVAASKLKGLKLCKVWFDDNPWYS